MHLNRKRINTSLDDVDTHILANNVDLLFQKGRRSVMDIMDAQGVLRSQCSSSCHGIASMGSNDFLVCF